MKLNKTLLIRIAVVLVLIAIAALMYFLGRGHTVYIDNKKLEYNGTEYSGPYKVEVYVDGERVAKLYDKERGSATCVGAKFSMDLVITQEKGGEESMVACSISLPYSMDGVVINLPGLLAQLPRDAWMSEFISTEELNPTDDEEIVTDEFAIDVDEGDADNSAG